MNIKVMAEKNFVLDKGTVTNTIKRGVDINGKKSHLSVTYAMNPKKGLITLNAKLDNDQIMTDDPVQNEATVQSLVGLLLAGMNKAIEWRTQHKKDNQEQVDPAQLPMGFGKGVAGEKVVKKVVKKPTSKANPKAAKAAVSKVVKATSGKAEPKTDS